MTLEPDDFDRLVVAVCDRVIHEVCRRLRKEPPGANAAGARAARATVGELPHVLTIHQLAAVLGRSVRWIEQQLSAGTFPIPRLQRFDGKKNRARLWSRRDVERFLEQDGTASRLVRSRRW